jgi:ubiquilin
MVRLSVRCSTGAKVDLDVDGALTVRELKERLAGPSRVAPELQRLIHKGRVLSDQSSLEHYGIADGDSLHLVQGAPAAAAAASVSAPSSATSSAAADPFGLGGGPGGDRMQSVMNSPMMQSLLNNPEMMQALLMANPQIQAMLEQNPQLRHVLNDPELLRQSLQAARNPAMMQEMMRNQDRALANIESLPGGFNVLRRMYSDVHEPMLDAAMAPGPGMGRSSSSSEQQQQQQQQQAPPGGAPMPNPWGAPPATSAPAFGAPGSGGSLGSLRGFPSLGSGLGGGLGGGAPRSGMFSPELIEAMNQQMRSAWGGAPFVPVPAPATTSAPAPAQSGPSLDGPNPWAPPSSSNSPEQRYRSQLEQLEGMGFPDRKANIQALLKTAGSVNDAVELLIEQLASTE